MNISHQEVSTQLNLGSALTNVRPERKKGKGTKAKLSFSDRLKAKIDNYLLHQKEIDALIAAGDLKGAAHIRLSVMKGKGIEEESEHPISPRRLGVIKSIVDQPYKLMLTVASPKPQSDQSHFNNVWFLLGKVNGYYFGRSFTKHRSKGLIGHVAAEPHTFSNHLRGSLNFHILLTQPPEITDIDEFRSVVLDYVPHVKGRKSKPVLDVSMVDVRAIWEEKEAGKKDGLLGLAQYVTKSMEHPAFRNGDYQMPLTPMGIQGICMRGWKDISNY